MIIFVQLFSLIYDIIPEKLVLISILSEELNINKNYIREIAWPQKHDTDSSLTQNRSPEGSLENTDEQANFENEEEDRVEGSFALLILRKSQKGV